MKASKVSKSSKKGTGLYEKRIVKTKVRKPGRHSKKCSSKNKNSKLYRKPYRGQGKPK